ncbi:alpha/beta fold hydrolase [Rubrobacter tropicus]|uniref:Alpha/beta fold hydrolase n=1 Tax=Rubrobacter tropicus TaxID=2653851 RepID=A0A6G8Q4F5_9ACTN|nr:alpha/beta fold hydrolase [Rubrobacter tropicus]QIN81333.1 alpha/beta fold hydrolase [Rubrobacter tropicus]
MRVRREKKFRRRRRLALLLVLLAMLLGILFVFWSWVDAQARAVVVVSSVVDAAVITPVAEAVSGEPRFSDETVAGNPALVARPAGEGPWPAVFFVNGTVPEGRKLPEARRLAEGFARAGYLVVLPDLPGLTRDRITPETVAETAEAARAISEHRDAADNRVALVGISTGSTLALLAAGEPATKDRVSVVAGVAPYSDIKTVVNVATTGSYEGRDGDFVRHRADPFLSYVVARSLVAALPPGDDRQALSSEIENVGREHPNPLGGLRLRRTEDLGPEARAVVALLANRDPNRFAGLYAALPNGVKKDLEAFSPLAAPGRIMAPVQIATGPQDKYFPASESRNLGGIAPDLRVTVTPALDHAELDASVGDVPALAGFNAFVVRSLRDARVEE